ncbi:MAG TPA: tetratricopeptide repeat protein [Tepidisphaeraceae bacterium]|nr:tetratricopeptide repeat protein [Tepidisphaeraceae bacterium]
MQHDLSKPPIWDGVMELGLMRMRAGVGSAEGTYLPRLLLWVDHRSGVVLHFEMTEPLDSYVPLVVNGLNTLFKLVGGLPRQIQVRNLQLADELREALEPHGIDVVVRESLPMLDEAIRSMQEFKKICGEPEPGLLDVPGMTLDHVIAFADAAKAFYEARPWQHLTDDDLIAIESPSGPPGTEYAQVLGAGGTTFGLGFVKSIKAHEDMRSGATFPREAIWSLLFSDIDRIAFDDGEAWERHGLAVAGPDAYPEFCCFYRSKKPQNPTPEQLTWAEGLLRALTNTTEEELDQGRWEKKVKTINGEVTYKFSMPLLLDQMAGKHVADSAGIVNSGMMAMEPIFRAVEQEAAKRGPMTQEELDRLMREIRSEGRTFQPTNDVERAQALCYQFFEARGRRKIQLVRQALAIDPDCCDALTLLAQREADPEAARQLLQRAVDSAQRRLGPERFEKDAGLFWGIVQTRPYMRAREDLAIVLMDIGELEQAASHFKEMLRLNPNDNQGNRYHLAQCLLALNHLDELDALLNRSQYKDDFTAEWAFTRTLLEYRRSGDSPAVRAKLNQARRRNKFVIPLLTEQVPLPVYSPSVFSPGDEDEAISCVEQISQGWHDTPGAVEWLAKASRTEQKRIRQWEHEREKKRKRR